MKPNPEWQLAMRQAVDPRAVMDIALHAVSRLPRAHLESLPPHLTPRRLESREDVEHWVRRMDIPAAMAQPARPALRQIFLAALLRLDEIGPARRRGAA